MNIIRHEMGPRFSEMVTVDLGTARLIYLSGQVAENPSLDITGQMREILQHIDAMLATIDELKALLVERRAALITDVVTGRKKVPA